MRSCGTVAGLGEPMMPMDVSELDAVACRALIANKELGRVVYTYRAMPAAAPVRYLLHEHRLYLVLPSDSELLAELSGQVISLLVEDDNEHVRRSVLMTGVCCELTATHRGPGMAAEPVFIEVHAPLVRGRHTRLQ